MTKKQEHEFNGFSEAKRMINQSLSNRIIELVKQDKNLEALALEDVRKFIRNCILYECEK